MRFNKCVPCVITFNLIETQHPLVFFLPLNANNFQFKPSMITLLPNFHGLESKIPYLHFKDCDEVCATFNDPPCANEIDKLKLCHFSLKDKAKIWFNNLKPGLIGSYPHHSFENWQTLSFFYEGLTPETKQFVETMCNEEFLDKEPKEAFDYLDHLVENSQSWHIVNPSEGSIRSNLTNNKGKYHLSQEDDLSAKMASLTRKVEAMELRKETLQEFMQTKTNFNNQTSQDINEIKSTHSMLTTSLCIQGKG
uniref:Retrotransposon gag domain-containing protein n=1 Tax=Gossypium raimondii TaxID=29730 RepID=A0A0D2R7N9_GOSRA|nr:hypothetical protein B456_010G138200 [Gossypium raimondii]